MSSLLAQTEEESRSPLTPAEIFKITAVCLAACFSAMEVVPLTLLTLDAGTSLN